MELKNIVIKIGSDMMSSPAKIEQIAKRLIEEKKRGRNVVAVVPSVESIDMQIKQLASSLSNKSFQRELDVLQAASTQIASSLLAISINKRGFKAVSLAGWQIGLITTAIHNHVRIEDINPDPLIEHFKNGEIVIIAGSQGVDFNNAITNLGDGGTETTAVAIASAIEALQVEIYTKDEGIFTANPANVSKAKKIKEMTYDELLELLPLGSKLIHPRAIELAKKFEIPIVIRSSSKDVSGTLIKGEVQMERNLIVRGVAYETDIIRLTVGYETYNPSILAELFSTLAQNEINVDIIVQTVIDGVKPTVSFSIVKEIFPKALKVLEDNKEALGFSFADFEVGLAKVSIVGSGMISNPGVAAQMFNRLRNENIPVKMVSTSEIKVSVVVPQDDMIHAANALHDEFNLA